MRYTKDSELIGHWFDRLYVLEMIIYKGRQYCKCQCICGNISYVRGSKLREGRIRSCGCFRDESYDMRGKIFGLWTAIKLVFRKEHHRYWLCRCSCGQEDTVAQTHLLQGTSTNCGCNARHNLTNIRHGRLLPLKKIIKKDNKGKKKAFWECLCDCGNSVTIAQNSLVQDKTKSCGCLSSDIIKKLRTTHGLSRTREHINWMARCRREKKNILDSGWRLSDELRLMHYFTACALCGSTETLTVDHLLPLNMGYGLSVDNAVVLCRSCNSSKLDRYITDLPPEIRRKLIDASCEYQDYYERCLYESLTDVEPL